MSTRTEKKSPASSRLSFQLSHRPFNLRPEAPMPTSPGVNFEHLTDLDQSIDNGCILSVVHRKYAWRMSIRLSETGKCSQLWRPQQHAWVSNGCLSSRVNKTNHRGWVIVPWPSPPFLNSLLLGRRQKWTLQVCREACTGERCECAMEGGRSNVSCISLGSKICNLTRKTEWCERRTDQIDKDRSIDSSIYKLPFLFSIVPPSPSSPFPCSPF